MNPCKHLDYEKRYVDCEIKKAKLEVALCSLLLISLFCLAYALFGPTPEQAARRDCGTEPTMYSAELQAQCLQLKGYTP